MTERREERGKLGEWWHRAAKDGGGERQRLRREREREREREIILSKRDFSEI